MKCLALLLIFISQGLNAQHQHYYDDHGRYLYSIDPNPTDGAPPIKLNLKRPGESDVGFKNRMRREENRKLTLDGIQRNHDSFERQRQAELHNLEIRRQKLELEQLEMERDKAVYDLYYR